MDSASSFAKQLKRGKIGEGYIARWLRNRGCHVLPVYEKEIEAGKGPVLYQAEGSPLIAPDMFCFNGNDKICWIEAKTKSAFTWHRITEEWTTGIDLHHYEDYIQIAGLAPWPIWLMFLQLNGRAKDSPLGCPTGLYGGELAYLQEHEHHRHSNWGRRGMVYWAESALKKLASLEELGLPL